jgi:hydrogenase maturation protease
VAPPLVIGIGNPDRGDDAIGLVVVRRLRELAPGGIEIAEADGEPAGLVEMLGGRPAVWLIDAAGPGNDPGTVRRFDVGAEPLPVALGSPSSHGLGVAEAIELARALGVLPAACVVFTIEAAGFEPGAPLTPAVAAAGETVACRLQVEVAGSHARNAALQYTRW